MRGHMCTRNATLYARSSARALTAREYPAVAFWEDGAHGALDDESWELGEGMEEFLQTGAREHAAEEDCGNSIGGSPRRSRVQEDAAQATACRGWGVVQFEESWELGWRIVGFLQTGAPEHSGEKDCAGSTEDAPRKSRTREDAAAEEDCADWREDASRKSRAQEDAVQATAWWG